MSPRLLAAMLALGAGLLVGGLTPLDVAQAANGYTTGNVNMRTGPGVNYPRIAVIPRGAAVTIRGCVRNHRWCDVTWRGRRSWVSARYLVWTRYHRPIYRPGYPPLWGGPIIRFRFERYQDRWYRDRPWYRKRQWQPRRKKRVGRREWQPPVVRFGDRRNWVPRREWQPPVIRQGDRPNWVPQREWQPPVIRQGDRRNSVPRREWQPSAVRHGDLWQPIERRGWR